MKKRSLLDSSALLAYLKKEEGHRKVKDLLSYHHDSKEDLLMNEINVGEVYYVLARERSIEAAEYFRQDILEALGLTMIHNTFADVIVAAKLKAKFPIAYADAFAAATSLKYDAILITSDPDFRKVEHLIEVEWLR